MTNVSQTIKDSILLREAHQRLTETCITSNITLDDVLICLNITERELFETKDVEIE